MLKITREIMNKSYAYMTMEKIEKTNYKRLYYTDALDIKNLMTGDFYVDKRLNRKFGVSDKKKVKTNTFPITFDIETNPDGTSWVQTFTINDTTIICRGWHETLKIFSTIESILKKMDDFCVGTVLIANLSFEFQYLMKRLEFRDVFATSKRKPLTATTERLYFIDPLRISNSSLMKLSDIYDLPTKKKVFIDENGKKVSDLDYNIFRTTKWEMSEMEYDYVCSDVEILADFWHWVQKNYVQKDLSVPLTSTGIDRETVKIFAKSELTNFTEYVMKTGKKVRRKLPNKLGKLIPKLFPETLDEYNNTMLYTFVGGYTKSNFNYTGIELTNVNGGDFTSSYPSVMMFEKFPMSKFVDYPERHLKNLSIDYLISQADKKASIVKVRFKKLHAKTYHSIHSISKTYEYNELGKSVSKCIEQYGMIIDNGRVYSSSQLTVSLTELDLMTFREFYEWDENTTEILSCKMSEKGFLPDYVRYAVSIFYQKKAELKRAGYDDTTEYRIAKAMVNSLYGMMCEKIHMYRDFVNDNGEWAVDKKIHLTDDYLYKCEKYGLNSDDKVDKNKKLITGIERGTVLTKKFLSPYWAVYCTAHARRNLLCNIFKCWYDVIYCDTDSMYFIDTGNGRKVMEDWNSQIHERNTSLIKSWNTRHGFDRSHWEKLIGTQKDLYREEHCGWLIENLIDLGEFDILNKLDNYSRFKTLGCKRYLKTGLVKDKKTGDVYEKTESVIAGLPKHSLLEYAEITGRDPYYVFNDKMCIPECKKTHEYVDEKYTSVIEDSQGNVEQLTEESAVILRNADFTLKLSDNYRDMIMNIAPKFRIDHIAISERIEKLIRGEYNEKCAVYRK